MTIVTPEQSVEDSAEILRGLQDALGALRREIEGLTEQAQSGGEIKETAVSGRTSKISSLLTHCLKAENTLNDCRNRQAGIARGGYALDMDKARADIGCKLDRLRRCSDPGAVSE
ncbi:hypothetical protein HTT03_04615 [Sulfitobacter sp. S0837]|uniref:hypothetical protein n=1 Tax=Sulfitobacter maritimus TaxID=2741719 RepID=UPI001583BDC2|nr:hypothetical protein [Sulfitobacter maritimus]NUH64586.1 hypothetical protein [Sulfitobacter maritimus]